MLSLRRMAAVARSSRPRTPVGMMSHFSTNNDHEPVSSLGPNKPIRSRRGEKQDAVTIFDMHRGQIKDAMSQLKPTNKSRVVHRGLGDNGNRSRKQFLGKVESKATRLVSMLISEHHFKDLQFSLEEMGIFEPVEVASCVVAADYRTITIHWDPPFSVSLDDLDDNHPVIVDIDAALQRTASRLKRTLGRKMGFRRIPVVHFERNKPEFTTEQLELLFGDELGVGSRGREINEEDRLAEKEMQLARSMLDVHK